MTGAAPPRPGWARSRRALEHYFDAPTARILDALIEGLTVHRPLDVRVEDDATALDAVDRVAGSGPR